MLPGLTEEQKLYLQKRYEFYLKLTIRAWESFENSGELFYLHLMFQRQASASCLMDIANCNGSHLQRAADECYFKGLDVMNDVRKKWKNG